MKKVITSKDAPKALGPYSQAIQSHKIIFASGQLGLDPATNEFPGQDASSQARQALKNLAAVLKAAGATPADVMKTTVLLVNMDDFSAVNEEYAKFFSSEPPARSCFAVAGLPRNAKVEIEAIAVLK